MTIDQQDDIAHHTRRAMDELQRGLGSQSVVAARAHLQLSSLHLQIAQSLTGDAEDAAQAA